MAEAGGRKSGPEIGLTINALIDVLVAAALDFLAGRNSAGDERLAEAQRLLAALRRQRRRP